MPLNVEEISVRKQVSIICRLKNSNTYDMVNHSTEDSPDRFVVSANQRELTKLAVAVCVNLFIHSIQ